MRPIIEATHYLELNFAKYPQQQITVIHRTQHIKSGQFMNKEKKTNYDSFIEAMRFIVSEKDKILKRDSH